METPGQVAYDAYRDVAGGVSLVTGTPLPEFAELTAAIRAAWEAAAEAVRLRYGAIY
jgi:hypothetical protein